MYVFFALKGACPAVDIPQVIDFVPADRDHGGLKRWPSCCWKLSRSGGCQFARPARDVVCRTRRGGLCRVARWGGKIFDVIKTWGQE